MAARRVESGSGSCTFESTRYSRLNSAADGIILRSPVSVLCVPPHLSGSTYLPSQELLPFTSNSCSGKGWEMHPP